MPAGVFLFYLFVLFVYACYFIAYNILNLHTLNSTLTLLAARWFPRTMHVRIVSLILESTKMACFVVTSNSCWILRLIAKSQLWAHENIKCISHVTWCMGGERERERDPSVKVDDKTMLLWSEQFAVKGKRGIFRSLKHKIQDLDD